MDAFQFVAVDVLRTMEYMPIRSIDIVSLTGNQVARRAYISIEQFVHPKFFARRAYISIEPFVHPKFFARRVGCKKLWALLKYLRSDFVVNVLRTKQYIHRIRSIDFISLREIAAIACMAFISIENGKSQLLSVWHLYQ